MRLLKNVIALMVIMLVISPLYASAPKDLNTGHWAFDAVQKLVTQGVFDLSEQGTFEPNRPITRGEVVSMLNRINQLTDEATSDLKDIEGTPFAKDIRIALKAGYIKGYPDKTFRPNAPVQRNEFAVMVSNLYDLTKAPKVASLKPLKDLSKIPLWARAAVLASYEAGLVTGYPDGSFSGSFTIRRSEAALVGYRMSESDLVQTTSNSTATTVPSTPPTIPPTTPSIPGGTVPTSPTVPVIPDSVRTALSRVSLELKTNITTELTTVGQRDLARIIATSIDRYLADASYVKDNDIQAAKNLAATFNETQKQQFKNSVLSWITVSELSQLKDYFNIELY